MTETRKEDEMKLTATEVDKDMKIRKIKMKTMRKMEAEKKEMMKEVEVKEAEIAQVAKLFLPYRVQWMHVRVYRNSLKSFYKNLRFHIHIEKKT